MQREIKVGTVSWINDSPNPMSSPLQAVTLSPDWIPKTYLGLSATSNPEPPASLPDFLAYQRDKNFRALSYCRFLVDIDDRTKLITSFRVLDAVHDGGWTPAFRMRSWPSTVFSFDMSIYSTTWYQAEYSPLSVVRTQARHPNTTISSAPTNEIVLVNALIKFRAGSHTDNTGINKVGSPYHVPWVWCEMVLTYVNGQFKAYGRGSIFPSHVWYFNDTRIKILAQVGDTTFPLSRGPVPMLAIQRMPGAHFRALPPPAISIPVNLLKIYPVLSKGAPAGGPQAPLTGETGRTGSVDTHPYTVSGGEAWSMSV